MENSLHGFERSPQYKEPIMQNKTATAVGAEELYSKLQDMSAMVQDALLDAKFAWQQETAALKEQIAAYEQCPSERTVPISATEQPRIANWDKVSTRDAERAHPAYREREQQERAEHLAAMLTEQMTAEEVALARAKTEAGAIVKRAEAEALCILGRAREEAEELRKQDEIIREMQKTREQVVQNTLLFVQEELTKLIGELDTMDSYIMGKSDWDNED